MARACTICTHTERTDIEAALIASEPYRHIASRYQVSTASLQRHEKGGHIPAALARAQDAKEVAAADDLLGQVKELRTKAIEILNKSEQAGDYRTALTGIREARACIELLMEVEGELNRGGDVHVHTGAVLQLQQVIIETLKPYPEARIAVGKALAALEAS